MNNKSKIGYTLLFTVLSFLVLGRVFLPYFLIQYVEQQINKIPEYQVKIKDIEVNLIGGSYTIKQLSLNKVHENIPVPFFSAAKINLAIQWSALLHGSLVAQIHAYQPILNFVIEPNNQNEQVSIDKEWQQAVKALFPLNFNKLDLVQGQIALHSFQGNPPFKVKLEHINFCLDNLQKVSGSTDLFSTFQGNGIINKGNFSITGRVDPFAKKPTFLLKSTLKSMQIKGVNDLLLHFIKIDVQAGEFSLYSEIAAQEGKITGYIKPIIKHLKILDSKKKVNPIELIYKGVMEFGSKIVTNQKKQTIATKINISGAISHPKTSILSIVGYVLRNAFIQALLPQLDHSVEMHDILLDEKKGF